MKRISVIVPVYKVETYLSYCIDSILAQSYKNSEIILVDDGSPDRCPVICDEYSKKYHNVRTIHKANGGLASARQSGFEASTGDYILFVDSDDYIAPNMVEILVNAIEVNHADIAICGYNTVWNDEITEHKLSYKNSLIVSKKELETKYVLPLMGSGEGEIQIPGFLCIRLHKRGLIQSDFFESERKYFVEDHIFDLLYADNIKSIAIVDEPLYFYRFNPLSLSNCYRQGKWTMYKNASEFFLNYSKEREIEGAESRIRTFISSGVFSSIDNAAMSGAYNQYKKELRVIRNDLQEMKSFQLVTDGFIGRIIIKILFKLHCDALLYWYRKKRIDSYYR